VTRSPHLRLVPTESLDDENLKNNTRTNEGNRLVEFLQPLVEPTKGSDNQHYVAFKTLPHLMFAHDGNSSAAMQQISHRSFLETNRWPSATAKGLAGDYLQARCSMSDPQEVSMRAQYQDSTIYLDTAWSNNQVIKIDSTGVSVIDSCPAKFVRNGVTAPLPAFTETRTDLRRLLHFVRIDEQALPALLASLINTFMTCLPQPLVLLQGPAAAGKTTSLRFLLDLVDPSTQVPGGSLTSNERDMRALSRVRRVMVFDNVSYVKGDVSDLLAKITTGSEMIYRALFENSTPDVMQLQRPVFLNGIINGFSRSDLASRSIAFSLEPISSAQRLSNTDLMGEWAEELPTIFWSLLDLASDVMRTLPSEPKPNSNFRNPELVKMTNIIGRELGIDGQSFLETSVEVLSQAVLGASPMGQAFMELVHCFQADEGHCSNSTKQKLLSEPLRVLDLRELLLRHMPLEHEKDIPYIPKNFGEAIQRLEGDLESVLGLRITKKRNNKGTLYLLELKEE
jgi:hypothetical protein